MGTVLLGPLIAGALMLPAGLLAPLIARMTRPRWDDDHRRAGLGPLLRETMQARMGALAATWAMVLVLSAVCWMSAAGWTAGRLDGWAVAPLGLALLGLAAAILAIGPLTTRAVRRQLDVLDVPAGPVTEHDLHVWRLGAVADDPQAGTWVRSGPGNWTMNIATRAGRVLALALLGLMVVPSLGIVLLPLLGV